MNLCKNILFILAFTTVFIPKLFPQPTNLKFDQIGLEQGLSQSTVYAIVQDKQGFMWFGTQDGLNRYDGYSIKVFKHDPEDSNSISDNIIRSLLCDNNGDLWIGTEAGGLNRYVISDRRFYHYVYNEADSLSISGNNIISIFEDSRNYIWIGTQDRGLNLFNKETGHFKRYFSNKTIWNICEDYTDNLWLTAQQDLYKLDLVELNLTKPHFMQFNHAIPGKNISENNNIRSFWFDREGNLWIGRYGKGLYQFNEEKESFTFYTKDAKNLNTISGTLITSMYEEISQGKSRLWIGTLDGGLSVYDIENNRFDNYQMDGVLTLYKDNSGIIWIGTSGSGVKIFNKQKQQFTNYNNYPNALNTLQGTYVSAILKDRDGELWVGTWSDGVLRFNNQGRNIKYNFNESNSGHRIGSNLIISILESLDGSIWVATRGGGLSRFDKKNNKFTHFKHDIKEQNGIFSNDISILYYDKQLNILWIGYAQGGISSYDIAQKKFKHYKPDKNNPKTFSFSYVSVIYKGLRTGLWIGTIQDGLYQFFPESNTLKNFNMLSKSVQPDGKIFKTINYNNILSICESDDGIVWIGTAGGGLNRYDPATDLFTYYTSKNGLSNDVVYGILPDKNGNLWLSTNKGISCFNTYTKSFQNHYRNDGLQENEFNQGAYFRSSEGEFFFGGVNGFNSFFPDEIKYNDFIPPVYFTSIKVFNETLPLQDPIPTNSEIKLSYSQNFFSFEFVALNFTVPEKNQYAYTLDGFDKDWHYVSANQRYASYTNLDPGKYVLHVKGSNNDGVWNETGTSVTIIITPPFWKTLWFSGLSLISIFLVVIFIYRKKVNALEKEKVFQQEVSRRIIEKQEEERSRIALEMHDVLGQDLLLIKNRLLLTIPKFETNSTIYKNLNNISENISVVLKTVREISHNLRPPDLDQLGLTEAIQSILVNMRNSTKLKVTGKVDNIDGLIPKDMEINLVRIVQEATGNIIKHAEADEFRIEVNKNDNNIIVEISDNGKGFEFTNKQVGRKHSGLGLIGMTERVRILGGKIKIESELMRGTQIRITIPIKGKIKI